jgi:hypothetical protein
MWTDEELAVANKEDIYIAAPNEDGTMHAPTWIWVVVADGNLYMRSYNGKNGRWYSAAKRAGHGQVTFGDIKKDVDFEDPVIDVKVDEAYKQKYAGSPYLEGALSEPMRSATVKLAPRTC